LIQPEPELLKLENLKYLDLYEISIDSLFSGFEKLKNLEFLTLRLNLEYLDPVITNVDSSSIVYDYTHDGDSIPLGVKKEVGIPESIFKLSKLKKIELFRNHDYVLVENPDDPDGPMIEKITVGSIPLVFPGVCTLKELEEVYISVDAISGCFSELKNLKSLTIPVDSTTNLKNIYPQIAQLNHLNKFGIYGELISLPIEYCNLTNLISLNLRVNRIISLPSEIGQLINLKKLDLSYNKLTSLPLEFRKLISLEFLDLTGNPLSKAEFEKIKEIIPKNCRIYS